MTKDIKARATQKQKQTAQGKTKVWKSNTDVKGNHTSAGEEANARRAAEQAAAAFSLWGLLLMPCA